MTIVEFLEARLAEDEAVAKAVFGADLTYATWTFEGDEVFAPMEGERHSRLCLPAIDEGLGIHIARHDPARTLREVAAKRAILAQEEAARSQFEHVKSSTTYPAIEVLIGQVAALATVIRHLTSAYSDHPDYQQEWAL